MRIALSPPWALATGLSLVAALVLLVTSPRPRVPQFELDGIASEANAGGEAGQIQNRADPDRQTRAELSRIERDLDALTDRVTSAVDALHMAQSEADVRVAHAELLRLRAEVAAERRLLAERARQLEPALSR